MFVYLLKEVVYMYNVRVARWLCPTRGHTDRRINYYKQKIDPKDITKPIQLLAEKTKRVAS